MAYERCYVGIPSIVISIVDNQLHGAIMLDKYNTINHICHLTVDNKKLIDTLNHYRSHPEYVLEQHQNCLKLVDGDGSKRIVSHIMT